MFQNKQIVVCFLLIFALNFTSEYLLGDNCGEEGRGEMTYSVKNIIKEPFFFNTMTLNLTSCDNTVLLHYMERACDLNKTYFQNFSQTYFPNVGYYVSAFNGVSENQGENYWELIEHSSGKQYEVGAAQYIPKDGDHVAWNLTEVRPWSGTTEDPPLSTVPSAKTH